MTVAIIALLSIIVILTIKHYVVIKVLVGSDSFSLLASVEAGRKRINPNSLFLIGSTLWLIYGLYLYIWRTFIFQQVQSMILVLEMPEALRQNALKISLLGWGLIGAGLTSLYILWAFVNREKKRKITLGSKGFTIGDMFLQWSEVQFLEVTQQRMGFIVDKKVHHYSWTLSNDQYRDLIVLCGSHLA